MGIFDFLLRGPDLKKHEAEIMATEIAIMLFTNQVSPRGLVAEAPQILDGLFSRLYPDHSVKPEQTREIMRLAVSLWENDKEYLEELVKRKESAATNPDAANLFGKDLPTLKTHTKTFLPSFKD